MKLKNIFTLITTCILVVSISSILVFYGNFKQTNVNSENTIVLTDFLNKSFKIEKTPERIICFSPSITELLYELGLGNKIVGVTKEIKYPPQIKDKEKVGKYSEIDIELVKQLNPDIIFTSKYTYQSIYNVFKEQNIPAVFIEPNTYNEMYKTIGILSKIFDIRDKGEVLANHIKQKIDEITQKNREFININKPNILYIQSLEPLYVAGSKTLINDIIELAGGNNAAREIEGYDKFGEDKLIERNIDIIIVPNAVISQLSDNYFKNHKLFKELNAVKNDNILVVPDQEIYINASPRVIKAVDEVSCLIYNYFKKLGLEKENEW